MIRALVVSGMGINCEREMAFAVEMAGGVPEIIHLNSLLNDPKQLTRAPFLLFPGGFSFGDELGAAKALANRLERMKEALFKFVETGGLILGVCNGFQLLVKLGLLPALAGKPCQTASLVNNDSGKFQTKWVLHSVPASRSIFTKDLSPLYLPIRHGEGKFIVKEQKVLDALMQEKQIALQYEKNVNGSIERIAAITDPTGRILGMMAHPEAALLWTHHPEWTRLKEEARRQKIALPHFGEGLQLFTNAIRYLEA